MKKIFIPLFSLALLLNSLAVFAQAGSTALDRSKIPGAGPAPVIRVGKYESFTLANGMKVFVVTNRKLPRVAFNLVLDYDPILEKAYAGYVDIAGQMLRSGTTTRTKEQLDEDIDFIGASLNTSATGISGASLKKHQPKLLELMADVLLNPSFPATELDRIKKETKSNIASEKDDPNSVASVVSNIVLYGKNHPYGEPTTEETVEKADLSKIKSFYSTYYKPNIAYLAIVGDITVAEAKTAVEKYFGKWKTGVVPKATYTLAPKPAKTRVALADRSNSVQSVIRITHTIDLKPNSPDVIQARVANDILGGQGGRLFNNLREKRGLTYGAYSSISPDKWAGKFTASASVRNAVTDSAVVEFFNELRKLRSEKVTEAELKQAKASITGSFVRSLESPQTIASFAINTARYGLPADYYANYLKNVAAVNADNVLAVAKKYVQPENAYIAVVGNGEEIAEKLKPFGEIDYYDLTGNKVDKAAKKEIPAGLTADKVIENYLKAIGGKDNLLKIKDVTMNMNASIQGQQLKAVQQQKAPNKYRLAIEMQGAEAFSLTSNGTKAAMAQMGNKQEIQGKALETTNLQNTLFPELYYTQLGVKSTLDGVENLDGTEVYKVELATPSGDKITAYFDSKTGLKIKQTSTVDSPQGPVPQSTTMSDYREVNSVKFPHKIVNGMGLQLEVQTVEVNKGLNDDAFEVK
ncbi:MAG: pitrilysin family protein [Bacteroidota bacterium]